MSSPLLASCTHHEENGTDHTAPVNNNNHFANKYDTTNKDQLNVH